MLQGGRRGKSGWWGAQPRYRWAASSDPTAGVDVNPIISLLSLTSLPECFACVTYSLSSGSYEWVWAVSEGLAGKLTVTRLTYTKTEKTGQGWTGDPKT